MSKIKVNRIENTASADGGVDIDATGHVTLDGLQMPTAGALSNRNLIINGAMQVAQRGTSSTSAGYNSVDRIKVQPSETNTQSQLSLTSTDTPYSLGFRNAFRLQNTTVSAAGANTWREIDYRIEAQDLNNSGWDYTSTNSFITFSFWLRASVTQSYYLYIRTEDGTRRLFIKELAVTADTWKKFEITIPGDSGITMNNDNGVGLLFRFLPWYGTTYTGSGTLDAWSSNTTERVPDMTSTWVTTLNSTFDFTGLQLEVGSKATPFEHRSFGDELDRCKRYFQTSFTSNPSTTNTSNDGIVMFGGGATGVTTSFIGAAHVQINPEMRATPTITLYDLANPRNTGKCRRHVYGIPGGDNQGTVITDQNPKSFLVRSDSGHSGSGIIFHYEVASEL